MESVSGFFIEKISNQIRPKQIFCGFILKQFRRNHAHQLGLPVIEHPYCRPSNSRFIEEEQFASPLVQLLHLVGA
jgi:hypothetical protein